MVVIPYTFKNFGFVYWIGAVSLLAWFFFVHSPPIVLKSFHRPLFNTHIVGVGWLCLACIHNTLITPSIRRDQHAVIGTSGLYFGAAGYVSGMVLAIQSFSIDPVFAIAISTGGTISGFAAITGYRDIQKYKKIEAELKSTSSTLSTQQRSALNKESSKYLKSHIQSMLGLFIMGCLLPAAIRVVEESQKEGLYIAVAVIGFNMIAHHYSTMYQRGSAQGSLDERGGTSEASALLDHLGKRPS